MEGLVLITDEAEEDGGVEGAGLVGGLDRVAEDGVVGEAAVEGEELTAALVGGLGWTIGRSGRAGRLLGGLDEMVKWLDRAVGCCRA